MRTNLTRDPAGQPSPEAVIIGADSGTGLQVARVLHGRGVPVIGVATNPRHSSCRSRAFERIVAADTFTAEFVDRLEALGPSLGQKAVLVPCTDMSVLLISRHRDRLRDWFRMALPGPDVVEMMIDKGRFYAFARKEGFSLPRTTLLETAADLAEVDERLFPCVVKPTVKTREWRQNVKKKVQIVETRDELRRIYESQSRYSPAMIVQEWIEGRDANLLTCNCYFDAESRPLVSFASRKLRQWPPEAGVGCISDEVRDENVVAETVRLFQRVHFHGFGYLEMKHEPRTGRYYIIEPNVGRPTGRSAMAEGCGVELHYTMYCDVLGLPLPDARQQQWTNTKWVYVRQDMQASAYYFWHRELTIREWLRSVRGPKVYAYWSRTDPLPFLVDFGHKVMDVLFRRKRAT